MRIFTKFKTQINMKTKIFFLITLFLMVNKISFSQNPTYTLRVDSMRLVSINAPNDAIEFGIYLTHTNAPTTFGFAGHHYFFSFNPGIVSCVVTDTTCLYYSIIGSQLPVSYQPRGPGIGTATNPSATLMRMKINAFQGTPGLDITGATNLLMVRMRLLSTAGSFNQTYLSMAWRNPPVVAFASKVFAYVNDINTDITTPLTHTIDSTGLPSPLGDPPTIALKLSVLPEGLYNQLSNLTSRRDTVKVYLRNTSSPYSIVDSAKNVIDSISFTNKFIFNNASSGTYYIVVKHFNSIETWSKSEGELFTLGDTTIYDFTTSITQAFGNNMKLKGSKYCIISGDVNQDGFIDGSDFLIIENDAYIFSTGRFIPSDLNGDNAVDGTDALIGDNNRSSIVITP